MKKRILIKIYGEVFGVGFRYSTCQKAQELGVLGYVKNYLKNMVLIEAEGEESKLKELLEWAKTGPRYARVEKVEYEWGESRDEFRGFNIQH